MSDHAMDQSDRAGAPPSKAVAHRSADALGEHPGEPPVVARLIVEIRSDGTRTIARGAMEDVATGQKVAVQADGSTPLSLALSLAKTIAATPLLARQAFRSLVARRR